MSGLKRRLETLEARRFAPLEGHTFLISWVASLGDEPTWAQCGDEHLDREPGETPEAFQDRAAKTFKPASGVRLVMLHMGRQA